MSGTDKVELNASKKKSKKPQKGSQGNPYFVNSEEYIYELRDGYTEFWVIQEQNKKNGPWIDSDSAEINYQNRNAAQSALKYLIEEVREGQKRSWNFKNNTNGRPEKRVSMYVGFNTTKAEIDKMIKDVTETFNTFQKPNKSKKEFKAPEYPKFRVARKTIIVKTDGEGAI